MVKTIQTKAEGWLLGQGKSRGMGETTEHFMCTVSVWEDKDILELEGGNGLEHAGDAT